MGKIDFMSHKSKNSPLHKQVDQATQILGVYENIEEEDVMAVVGAIRHAKSVLRQVSLFLSDNESVLEAFKHNAKDLETYLYNRFGKKK